MKKPKCEACGHRDCAGWKDGDPIHEYRGKGNWVLGCHCDGCTKSREETGGLFGAISYHLSGESSREGA